MKRSNTLRSAGLALLISGTALLAAQLPDFIKGAILGVAIGILLLSLIAGRKKYV